MLKREELHNALKAVAEAENEAKRIIAEGMGIGKEYHITDGLDHVEEGDDEEDGPFGIFTHIDNDNPVMIDKARRTEHDFEFHVYECNNYGCDFWVKDWQLCGSVLDILVNLKCDDE